MRRLATVRSDGPAARGPNSHDQLLLRPRLPSVGGRVGLAYESESQLLVHERILSGFLQRHQGESTEPELSSTAADGETLDPAPTAGWPHIEIEALAVAIAPGVAHVAEVVSEMAYPPIYGGCKRMLWIDLG